MDTTLSLLKALADRNRLRIVLALSGHEELCACQLVALLEVTPATASRHLKQLVVTGLLDSRRQGRWVYYRLRDDAGTRKLLKWLRKRLASTVDAVVDAEAMAAILVSTPEEICLRQRGPSRRQSSGRREVP